MYNSARAAKESSGGRSQTGQVTRVALASGQQVPVYVHSLHDVRALQLQDASKLPPGAAAVHRNVIDIGRASGLVPIEDPVAGAGLGVDGGVLTEACVKRDLLAFEINNFTLVDEAQQGGAGVGVYPSGAMINHACCANAGITYAFAAGLASLANGELTDKTGGPIEEQGPDGRPMVAPPRSYAPVQIIRALRPIAEGEDITHSYVEPLKPILERRVLLQQQYGFRCECAACAREVAAETETSVAAEVWGATPVAPADESEDDRTTNMARAQAMVTHNEVIAAEPGSEIAREIKAKMREEGTPVQEDVDWSDERAAAFSVVRIQTAVLTHALKIYNRYLPPFHPDTVKVVGAVLGAAALVDDHVTAEAAACHAIAGHAGGTTVGTAQCHPLLVLQQYAALDRYLEWATALDKALADAAAEDAKAGNSTRLPGGWTPGQATIIRGFQAQRAELARLFLREKATAPPEIQVGFPIADDAAAPTSALVFTPAALRAHAAALLPEVARRLRVAYGDCRITRQLTARAQEAATLAAADKKQ